jgi:hypothetical protein
MPNKCCVPKCTENYDAASDRPHEKDSVGYFIFQRYLESKWIIKHLKDCVCIGLTDFDDVPRFIIFVRVCNDLSIDDYKGQLSVNKQSLQWILDKDNKLCCWSQLDSLISHFDSYSTDATFTVNDKVAVVEQALTELHNMMNDNDDYTTPTLQCSRQAAVLVGAD